MKPRFVILYERKWNGIVKAIWVVPKEKHSYYLEWLQEKQFEIYMRCPPVF